MPIKYNDVKQMVRDVDRISRNVYLSAFNDAMMDFEGQIFLDLMSLDEDEKMFEYTPKDRQYIFGANNVQPASCSSVPMDVETSSGDTVRGLTHLFESGYHLCIEKCNKDSLEEEVYNKEKAAALVLINMLHQQMWYGVPELMQYGLLNHPLIELIESPPTRYPGEEQCGGGDNCGSSKWEHKTINEIVKEIRSAIRHYINPQIIMSERAYENSMSVIDERLLSSGTYGVMRYEQVESALRRQGLLPFSNIIPHIELDAHPKYDNKDIAIVHDRGAMALTASQPIWMGSYNDAKNVHVIRKIRTGGLRINYEDAVKIIVGV